MQAAGQVPELLERAGQPVAYLVHIGADVGRRPVADTAQHERQGHQVLLDAVVQIPFDPAAHLIAHGEDPAAGGGQLAAASCSTCRCRSASSSAYRSAFSRSSRSRAASFPYSRPIQVPSAGTAAISATVVTTPWAPRMANWSYGTVKK